MFSDFFNNWRILNICEIFLSILIKSTFLEFDEIFFIIFKSCKFINHLINKFSNSSFGVRVCIFIIILFKFLEFIANSFKLSCEFLNFFSSKIDSVRNFAFIHIGFDVINRFSAFICFSKNDCKIFLLILMLLLKIR